MVDRDTVADLAIVGAGVAGTYLAQRLLTARPEWAIRLLERHDRIGGRLRSVRVDGIAHPIELGGMRYLTSHQRAHAVVTDHGIPTRPFDGRGAPERSYLRGRVGGGPTDPEAGAGYDLGPEERGRSAIDLATDAFERVVPGAGAMDRAAWVRQRGNGSYRGRALTDWTIAEAFAAVLSPEGHRFVTDAFGYDSGIRPHNAGDAIEYLLGGGDPSAEARVPLDGMDRIPNVLAQRFADAGGSISLGVDVRRIASEDGVLVLEVAEGPPIRARHVALTTPVPALRAIVDASPLLAAPGWQRLLGAVEGFPATKLYAWFERPWWRDGSAPPAGIRTTTDLPIRKSFYFDDVADRPAAMLASYTDGREVEPIVRLAEGRSDGAPASDRLWRGVAADLRTIHPGTEPPPPVGTAFMHWGSDPREIGWTYWRAGINSDEIMAVALQPDPALPLHVCGETFSRAQAWVEGALETAESVADRLTRSS